MFIFILFTFVIFLYLPILLHLYMIAPYFIIYTAKLPQNSTNL